MSIQINLLHKVEKQPIKNDSLKKPVIIFVHGNSTTNDIWKNQLNEDRFKKFQMIAFDLPGHGKSTHLQDYSIKSQSQIIVENCRKYEKIILVGHSLGGHLVIEALPNMDNCIGCLIIGTPPVKQPINLDEAFLPNEKMGHFFVEKLNKSQVAEVAELLVGKNHEWVESIKIAIKKTDSTYRPSIAKAISSGEFSNQYEILKESAIPIAIFHGTHDSLVNLSYLNSLKISQLWKGKIIAIPDSGHSPQMENPKLFNELFLEFLITITK